MNDGIKFTTDLISSFKGMKLLTWAAVLACVLISTVSVAMAFRYAKQQEFKIYVLEKGSIMEAVRAENGAQRDLEVIDHVTRFHELFYNIAPNVTTINQNINRALELADKSAYQYFNNLKERQYFSTLIDINATQQISVDSVKVDIMQYPYKVKAYSSLYVLRESTIALYKMQSSCDVIEAGRTQSNPHGLMITNYYAENPRLIESRNR